MVGESSGTDVNHNHTSVVPTVEAVGMTSTIIKPVAGVGTLLKSITTMDSDIVANVCTQCSKVLEAKASFCSGCGTKVAGDGATVYVPISTGNPLSF